MPQSYLLIGSGIAALSAAEAIRAADRTGTITMVSEETHDFYSRPGLAYLLRGDIPERQLGIRSREDLKELRLERIHARVRRIDPAGHTVVLTEGQVIRYDRLLLAPGALALRPSFDGGDLAGVVKLDSLDDARRILKSARRGRVAVVVGGGITALELAEGLRARGMEVHYLLRGNGYWSGVLDEAESSIILGRLRQEGIKVHFQTQVAHAVGTAGKLRAVVTEAGEKLPCDQLAVAIGVRPRIELARDAGLAVNRGIVVDEYLQTSAADHFAAGDAAEVLDPVTGSAALEVLWPTALRQGRIAGGNLAGLRTPYLKEVAVNVTQLAGLKVTIIGAVGTGGSEELVAINRGESESWQGMRKAMVMSSGDEVNRVRLVLDEQRIAGALVMGAQDWSHPLQELIAAKADISSVRSSLLGGGREALDTLQLFHQQWVTSRK